MHCESNLIAVQQDATVFSLLHFCRQLYMFRLLTSIIRSSHNCNYSFWHWSTGSTTIRSPCSVGTTYFVVPDSCVCSIQFPFDGTGQPGLLPSALLIELELHILFYQTAAFVLYSFLLTALVNRVYYHPLSLLRSNSATRADGSIPGWPVSEAVITAVRAPDDGCQHPKHAELPTEM